MDFVDLMFLILIVGIFSFGFIAMIGSYISEHFKESIKAFDERIAKAIKGK